MVCYLVGRRTVAWYVALLFRTRCGDERRWRVGKSDAADEEIVRGKETVRVFEKSDVSSVSSKEGERGTESEVAKQRRWIAESHQISCQSSLEKVRVGSLPRPCDERGHDDEEISRLVANTLLCQHRL
jgi:hypothetical protein